MMDQIAFQIKESILNKMFYFDIYLFINIIILIN